MLNLSQVGVLFVVSTELFLGTWLNGFIVLLHCITWVRTRKISLSDFIILNLALSTFILQGIPIMDIILQVFYPHFHGLNTFMRIIDIFWIFTNNLSICLTTCLNVFYCLKIANFSHQTFLWLKWRFSHVVVWSLLGSVPYSFFSTLALILKFNVYSNLNQIKLLGNCTEDDKRKTIGYFVMYILSALYSVIPLFLSLFSSVLLILSLMRHTRQMQHYANGTRDLSTTAHVRATKAILSSLLFLLGYFLVFFLAMSSHFLPDPSMAGTTSILIFAANPSIQTFVLILENQKLKQAFLRMFQVKKWRLKC
ncbi:taste receptor type 2 member 3-like [Gracilinanus agilis]|uniref:taste receptor type 2 member 3-like n=1 Tax=Gracilinanus agilis TaxID=191870 RepID=UPI001CFE5559|nr:taste receptor type 2 member 3-like [Gracilinanus agilis]